LVAGVDGSTLVCIPKVALFLMEAVSTSTGEMNQIGNQTWKHRVCLENKTSCANPSVIYIFIDRIHRKGQNID